MPDSARTAGQRNDEDERETRDIVSAKARKTSSSIKNCNDEQENLGSRGREALGGGMGARCKASRKHTSRHSVYTKWERANRFWILRGTAPVLITASIVYNSTEYM